MNDKERDEVDIEDCECEFCRKENDLRLAIRLGGYVGNLWLEQAPEFCQGGRDEGEG